MKELMEYFDNFGTKLHFYTDKNKKYYTVLGGIFSIASLFFCAIIFVYLVIEDIRRSFPKFVYISDLSREKRNIKLAEENIFIPWHIVMKDNDLFNYSGLIYPNITYYYYDETKNSRDILELKTKKINYKLCNETSMVNLPDIYLIEKPLNELYCIDVEGLEIENSNNESNNYLKVDFFFCENYIDYTNQNCSNLLNNNIYFDIEIFYPEIRFDPTNIKNPISIIYISHFDYFNNFSTKINKIFLQENILVDDIGWIGKSITKTKFWNTKKIYCDTFQTFNSSSELYSIIIFFQTSIKILSRRYEKIYPIISGGLPIVNVFYILVKKIAKLLKVSEENRRLIELLFENLVEKKNKFKEKLNKKKINDIQNNNNNNLFRQNNLSEYNRYQTKNTPNFSSFRKSIFRNAENNIQQIRQNKQSGSLISSPSFINNNNDNSRSILLNLVNNNRSPLKINNNHTIFSPIQRRPIITKSVVQHQINKKIIQKKENIHDSGLSYNAKKLVPAKLFPYKYYFFMIFIKNLDISKRRFCFPRKFVKANLFIRQLLDISSYLFLQREFHVLKNQFLTTDELHVVENNSKININNHTFSRVMNKCIENQKFYIFSNNIENN